MCGPRSAPVAVALLAIGTAVLLELNASARAPRAGQPITPQAFAVDTGALAGATEGVHEAAERLASTFAPSAMDDALTRFLDASAAATASRRGQLLALAKYRLFCFLQTFLGWSRPDASGFTRKATLHVASSGQLRALVGGDTGLPSARSLLDVGSGTGSETAKLAAALSIEPEAVVCLETSSSMRAALAERGFRVAGSPTELPDDERFS